MAAVSRLGPGAYPRPPYGSFAGKPASSTDSKSFVQNFSVLGPGGYPRPPYASFAGRAPVAAVTLSAHPTPFSAFQNFGRMGA
jgi:hypothetical protein